MTSQRCGVKDLIDFKTSDAFIVFYPCEEPTVAFCFFIEAAVIADSVVTSIRQHEPLLTNELLTRRHAETDHQRHAQRAEDNYQRERLEQVARYGRGKSDSFG